MPTPKEIVHAWVQAFNRADVEALSALYADDAINHQVVREPVRGRAAIRHMFEREFSTASRFRTPRFRGVPTHPAIEGGTDRGTRDRALPDA